MSGRKRFYRRMFLNRAGYHTTADILAKVSVTDQGDGTSYTDADVRIDDCSNQVNLDFSFKYTGAKANAINKARKLERVFGELADVLEECPASRRRTRRARYEDPMAVEE